MPYTEAIYQLEAAKGANIIRTDLYETEEEAKEAWREKNRQLEDAISHLKIGMVGGTSALISLVRQWGVDKGIISGRGKATVESQFQKLLEEVDEIREGIEKKDQMEILDGIGDTTVVLILLADLAGLKFEACLQAAYDEIKGRTGRMVDGKFVKDA